MENSFEYMDELISKYLAAETSSEEAAVLYAWRSESEQNERYFLESKKLFEAINAADVLPDVNVDMAWQKLNSKISETETKIIPLHKKFTFVRVAASLVLIVALGFIINWLMNGESSQPTILLAGNTTAAQNLPDGSKVFMNKNAELSYATSKGKRVVKLKGEAFFEVVHNEAQPFIIEINDIIIKDIGTAFNVKALPGSNLIEVLVESGEVQFYNSENSDLTVNGLTLIKGEKAVYDKTTKLFNKVEITSTDNSMSYRSKIFHFKNASLKEVITSLNEVYGSDIRLADKDLGNCRLSVEFNNEDIDILVSIIAETLDLEVERTSTSITLKGTSCPE